jgi:hypothetical protein
MHTRPQTKARAVAAVTALALAVSATVAAAQPAPPPPGYGYGDYGPPPGQDYTPPPGGPSYDQQAYYQDQQYASNYQAWASRYCVQQRNNNVAAGAVIGGALGAILGGGIGGHARGAVIGGALGAGTGAAVAANSGTPGGCPPGFVIGPGAPAYVGPVIYAPGWYNPWVFEGGRYVYVPYRTYYWRHHGWRHY